MIRSRPGGENVVRGWCGSNVPELDTSVRFRPAPNGPAIAGIDGGWRFPRWACHRPHLLNADGSNRHGDNRRSIRPDGHQSDFLPVSVSSISMSNFWPAASADI